MSDGITDAAALDVGPAPFLAVLDPPWSADSGGGRRGANTHYSLANAAVVACAVRGSGLWQPEGPALVWMWATSSAVVKGDAHELADLLGVRICCGFVWNKVDVLEDSGDGEAYQRHLRPGLGQWSRCEHEHLLLCRRGDVSVPPPESRCRSTIYAPRGRHSAKPPEAWGVIEVTSRAVLGDEVQGVEFFARSARAGWASWGNEAPAAP